MIKFTEPVRLEDRQELIPSGIKTYPFYSTQFEHTDNSSKEDIIYLLEKEINYIKSIPRAIRKDDLSGLIDRLFSIKAELPI